jgi:hypothetical protein
MQKISSYLYPNRIELLADLATFTVEYVNVYQRTIKIYKGINNIIEFDIKNADQKRIPLSSYIVSNASTIKLNVMDASGNALPNSPYTIDPVLAKPGIAVVTIPSADLANLDSQFLKYSVTIGNTLLYADSRFGAVGTIELVGDAMPIVKKDRVYDTFTAEIDLKGQPIYHSSAIPAKFYEAVPTQQLSFDIDFSGDVNQPGSGFTGSVWIEATKNHTINTEAFKGATYLQSFTATSDLPKIGTVSFTNIPVGEYQYFRVSYATPTANGVGATFNVTTNGTDYVVDVRAGGTGYAAGAKLKVLGSLLGGVDGINDLFITVQSVDGASTGYISSYSVSSAVGVTWTGVAVSGTAQYIVTGTNITGSVDRVTVS